MRKTAEQKLNDNIKLLVVGALIIIPLCIVLGGIVTMYCILS